MILLPRLSAGIKSRQNSSLFEPNLFHGVGDWVRVTLSLHVSVISVKCCRCYTSVWLQVFLFMLQFTEEEVQLLEIAGLFICFCCKYPSNTAPHILFVQRQSSLTKRIQSCWSCFHTPGIFRDEQGHHGTEQAFPGSSIVYIIRFSYKIKPIIIFFLLSVFC